MKEKIINLLKTEQKALSIYDIQNKLSLTSLEEIKEMTDTLRVLEAI